jgi:UDP-N-acetylglucosamine 2-epimerase
MKKLAIVVGARPQFIKLGPLVEALADKMKLVVIHTGQHYDFEMSDIFFSQLALRKPDYHLGVGSASSAGQTGAMMIALDEVFRKESPNMVIVTGDTNSTLAGALAAAQNRLPLIHIEAGLRSKDKWLPEQINRVVTDKLADILCCPTKTSVDNLCQEGIVNGVALTGDVLYDAIGKIIPEDERCRKIVGDLGLEYGEFIYLTTHRAENVDSPEFLTSLTTNLEKINHQIFFPIHPRTLKNLRQYSLYEKLSKLRNVIISKPIGIIESLAITRSAIGVVTDSGGLQREAAYFGKRTYLLRDETEWNELARSGIVVCLGRNSEISNLNWQCQYSLPQDYFQKASTHIADLILNSPWLA